MTEYLSQRLIVIIYSNRSRMWWKLIDEGGRQHLGQGYAYYFKSPIPVPSCNISAKAMWKFHELHAKNSKRLSM